MAKRLMRWSAYAVFLTIIVTWSYVLHQYMKETLPKQPLPSRVRVVRFHSLQHGMPNEESGGQGHFLNLDKENNLNIFNAQYHNEEPVEKIAPTLDQKENKARYIDLHKPRNTSAKFIPKNKHLKRNLNDLNARSDKEDTNKRVYPLSPDVRRTLNKGHKIDYSLVENNARYNQVRLEQAEAANFSNKKVFPIVLPEDDSVQIEKDLIKRRDLVKKTCYKYGLGAHYPRGRPKKLRYPPSANYDVLYIDRSDALTWCPVYKAASTTWLHVLSVLAGAKQSYLDSTSEQISIVARRLYPPLEYEEAHLAVAPTTKFMIVRDPLERLISAYRDKLENLNIGREHGVEFFYAKYGRNIVQRYRTQVVNSTNLRQLYLVDVNSDLPLPRGIEPTFAEFVAYILNTDLVHHADDHWMPYYLYCTPCYLDYNVIAKFETLERDQNFLLHKLKLDEKIHPKWKHLTKGKQTSVVVKKYLSSISKSDVKKLTDKYKIDFEMYGYSMKKYQSYGKPM